MDIYEGYKGKNIFATGVTGFVGKVWLWKLMKEFPDIGDIYLLVRPKKGVKPNDRVEKEVFGSMCFDGLRKELGPEEFARRRAKVHGVAGDIMEDRLGMSDADYSMLSGKLHQIMHLAATVDFNEKLNTSVQMNVLGTLRVFALAQKCKNMEAFVHVSTCYVNYNRHSKTTPVKEVLYPLAFEPEAMCKYILSLHDDQIALDTDKLLKKYGFPNTYTLTKSMAEQIVHKRKGNLPVAIVRPSIVAAANREPYPGWCDVLTAAGGIFLTAGLGILRELNCETDAVADVVPVDFVANTLIKTQYKVQLAFHKQKALSVSPASANAVAAPKSVVVDASAKGGDVSLDVASAAAATTGGSSQPMSSGASILLADGSNSSDQAAANPSYAPSVFHSSTSSSENKLVWKTCLISCGPYLRKYSHPKAIAPFDCALVPNRPQYLFRFYTRRVIPVKLLQLYSQLPYLGNEKNLKDLQRLEKALKRVSDLDKNFRPFMTRQWTFDCANSDYLNEGLNEKSYRAFASDTYDINWWYYCIAYSNGLVRYVMKVDDPRPQPPIPQTGSEIYMKAAL